MDIGELDLPVGTIVIEDDNGELQVLSPEDKKRKKRLAKKNLLKIINLLTHQEKKKMLEATAIQGAYGAKKTSMGIKTWVINNIQDKSRFYDAGLLVPPMVKMPKVEEEISVELT